MNRFIKDHLELQLPRGTKPRDFVRAILTHFGLYLGGVFSLTSCKDNPKCCNPFHYHLTLNKRTQRHLKNQFQDIRDLAEETDWDLLKEVGFNQYLKMYNSSEFILENPFLAITKTELIQAMVLKTLELPANERTLFWDKLSILDSETILSKIENNILK